MRKDEFPIVDKLVKDSGCWIRYKMFEQIIQKAETIIEVKLESEE